MARSGSPCSSVGRRCRLGPCARCPPTGAVSRSTSRVELLLGGALGRRADDDAGVLGHDLLEDRLEPGALGVGQLAADAGHRRRRARRPGTGRAARPGWSAGRPCGRSGPWSPGPAPLSPDFSADSIARGLALQAGGVPVDLAGVEHGVAALADVDERRLHARAARSAPGRGRRCRRSESGGWPGSRSARPGRRPRARRSGSGRRVWRTTMARSTASRRARNSASVMIGAGGGPARGLRGGAAAWPPAGSSP